MLPGAAASEGIDEYPGCDADVLADFSRDTDVGHVMRREDGLMITGSNMVVRRKLAVLADDMIPYGPKRHTSWTAAK